MSTAALSFAWPEVVAVLAGLLVVANAARRGFLREGSLLLGLGLALWLAGALYRPVGALLLPRQGRGDPWSVALFAALTLTLLVATVGLSALAAPLVRRGPLLGLDRLAGALVGLGEWVLALGIVALVVDRLGVFHPPAGGLLARASALVATGLVRLTASVPPELLGPILPR